MFAKFCVSTGLFKGSSLAEELAFVRYFHNRKENVWLHILGFHFFCCALLSLLKFVSSYLEILFITLYISGLIALDVYTGVLGGCILAVCFYAVELVYNSFSIISIVTGFGTVGGAFQLFGHIYYDKSQPAFRFFEAFFTTPFYLYLYVLTTFGIHLAWYDEIKKATMMWKGSERVVYGERIIN